MEKSFITGVFAGKFLTGTSRGLLLVAVMLLWGRGLMAQTDTEFWFAAPKVTEGHHWIVGGVSTAPGGEPIYLKITTQALPAVVRVTQPANQFHPTLNPGGFPEIVVSLPENTVHVIDLTPYRSIIESTWLGPEPLNNFGLNITSSNLITVYYEVGEHFNPDIFSLKGNNALGTEFYTPFQTYYNNPNQYTPRPYSAIDVVATMDNTEVTFTTTKPSTLGPAGSYTIALNRGQTYSVAPFNRNRFAVNRLDGTKITSNHPIAVTIKDDSVGADPHGTCRDLIGDQLIPTSIIGTEYIVMKGRLSIPEFTYVLATQDGTEVYINNVYQTTLNEHQTYRHLIPAGTPTFHIRTTHPSYVLHVAGFGCEMGGAILPPVNVCTGSTQVGFNRSKGGAGEAFFLNILVRAGAEDGFLFNGAPHPMLDASIFQAVPGTSDWLAANIGPIIEAVIPVGVATMVSNTRDVFHLGVINGGQSSGTMYGYFSDFNELSIRAVVAGTTSNVLRTCYGVPVRLFASGGTNIKWEPYTYLDDPFSATPLASPLTSTLYRVSVSGACNMADTATISVQVSTPVEAMFTFDEPTVCAPEEVRLRNQSTGGTNFRWYINNTLVEMTGTPVDLSYTFQNDTDAPIEYSIDLVVRNNDGCSDQMSRTITVYPAINSDFSAIPVLGCDPLDVVFTNLSTGNTDKWYWDFGDGMSSAEEEPAHTYLNRSDPDNITREVSLVAISPFQCRDTFSTSITISPYIEAGFTFDQPSGCSPWELLITDESVGADTYFWDFGDGSTSVTSLPEFLHLFENTGNSSTKHTIRLRVANDEGCEDIMEREVTVHPGITAAFTAAPEDGCSPHTVSFINNSEGAARYLWDLGDGTTSPETSPVHTYPLNLGSEDIVYDVTLTAISDELCIDVAQLEIIVHPWIEASFTIDRVEGCHPLEVTINNQSRGAVTYLWDFGDGSAPAVTSAPFFTHIYRNTASSDTTFLLRLTVTNNQGCTDTLIREIVVYPELTANFMPGVTSGCEPLQVSFADLSKNAAKWDWDFGDGTGSDEPSPLHTFINTGNTDLVRNVTLTTTSLNGQCTATNSLNITVHARVNAGFETGPDTGCNPFEAVLINNSTGASVFRWNFGDGATLSTTSAGPVTHTFINNSFSDTRSFDITLVAENYAGCTSEVTRRVNVFPDIRAAFDASVTEGCHPLRVSFSNQTEGGWSYQWDFGDGNSTSLENPSHTFSNTGDTDSIYLVRMVAVAANNVCSDTSFMEIVVHPYVRADFNLVPNSGCNPSVVEFENTSLNASFYRWDFGDGTDTVTYNQDPFPRYFENSSSVDPATYIVTMIAVNYAGCTSEAVRIVTIHPDINAEFAASNLQGCHPLTVQFTGLSSGATHYIWDFGDGSSSSEISPVHTFSNTGSSDSLYRVMLRVRSPNNVCTDSFYLDIRVYPLVKADFSFDTSSGCTPLEVEFTNSSTGGSNFIWDFGDGNQLHTDNIGNVIHTFTNPSYTGYEIFRVSLTAENYAGCSDNTEKTVRVHPDIRAHFEVSDEEGCHPLKVEFSNLSSGAHRHEWDFGDGTTSTAHSPEHIFRNSGSVPLTRTVTLRVWSGDLCTDEQMIDITVHPNPRARFEIDNTANCPPFDLEIVNTSINADRYRWIFGDGTSMQTHSNGTFYQLYDNHEQETKTYILGLVAETDFGCVDSTSQEVRVYPGVNAGFNSVTTGCSPLEVDFENLTTGAINYRWNFGDGLGINIRNPRHVYFNNSFNDTTYYVQLTGISEFGCTDIAGYGITVYPQPVAEFSVSPVYQEYPSVRVDLNNASSDGIWQYEWDFDDGNTNGLRDPGSYEFGDWGEYNIRLRVWNDHCLDTASHRIFIRPPVPIPAFDPPVSGCVPHTVQFRNNSVYGHSYYWDFDDGNISREPEPRHTYTEPGVYNVKLIVTGEGGEEYIYRQLEVYRPPIVNFKVVPDTVLLPDEMVYLFNMSEYGTRYEWNFGDGNYSTDKNPTHLYTELGEYDISLAVWTGHECYDIMYLEKAVTVTGSGEIIFPNAFRPDLSGPSGGYYDLANPTSNTIFRPYWEGVTEYRLRIYNRWGEFLFESNDVMQGWDGYYKGRLSKQDVYVWKVWGSFTNGKKFVMAGDVTLLR